MTKHCRHFTAADCADSVPQTLLCCCGWLCTVHLGYGKQFTQTLNCPAARNQREIEQQNPCSHCTQGCCFMEDLSAMVFLLEDTQGNNSLRLLFQTKKKKKKRHSRRHRFKEMLELPNRQHPKSSKPQVVRSPAFTLKMPWKTYRLECQKNKGISLSTLQLFV